MNCPGCGGSLKPVGNRNHLQCEHCGRFHFPDELGDGLILIGQPSDYSCPVCPDQLLGGAMLEGQPVHTCSRCRGLLSDLASFGYAVASRRSRHKKAAIEKQPFDPLELCRHVKCPRCQHQMENYPYAGGGNVVVDACDRCQLIWLDAGELQVISNYVPAPSPRSSYLPPSPVTEDEGLWSLLS